MYVYVQFIIRKCSYEKLSFKKIVLRVVYTISYLCAVPS